MSSSGRQVLPLLRQRFPQTEARLAASAAHAGEAQALLAQLAAIDANSDAGGVAEFPLTLACLRTLDPARAANLLRVALAAQGLQAPPAARLSEFVRQCREAGPDRHPALVTPEWTLEARARQVWLRR